MDEAPLKKSTHVSPDDFDQARTFQGWVQETRDLGGISFLMLRDGWGTIQVTAPRKKVPQEVFETIISLPRESVIEVVGKVQESEKAKSGVEVIPSSIQVLSRAASPLPMGVVDKVGVEVETRFNHRFMDLRRQEVRAIFQVKSLVLQLIGEYLTGEDFVEVFTPKIVASGAEGGATLFPVEYFEGRAFLAQSPQLYKQALMATGLDRVFEISPAFRAEHSDTIRHTAEFISFDGEMAFIDSQRDVMEMMEGCMQHVIDGVIDRGQEHLEAMGVELDLPRTPYPVMTYSEVRDILSGEGKEIPQGEDIDTEGEKILGEVMAARGYEMYWIIEYPEASKPFYVMEKEGTPYSHTFDLDYRGQEISSGGQREHRYDHLVGRMEGKGLDPSSFRSYMDTFAYGMPPHGGWGLGLERFVQKMLGLSNIREAILFPRDRNRLTP
ncbi:MAG: aspartate--tRNA(Asn) ligase [Methanomassiliicoccales archaeon]